jgi:hypothetical protein
MTRIGHCCPQAVRQLPSELAWHGVAALVIDSKSDLRIPERAWSTNLMSKHRPAEGQHLIGLAQVENSSGVELASGRLGPSTDIGFYRCRAGVSASVLSGELLQSEAAGILKAIFLEKEHEPCCNTMLRRSIDRGPVPVRAIVWGRDRYITRLLRLAL